MKEQIRAAAIKSLAAEVRAILNIPALPIEGKMVVRIPADRVPELLRRIDEYERIALTGG